MKRHPGLVIGKRRRVLNVQQRRVAEMAGISQPYLSLIESGKKVPSRDVLDRIRTALGTLEEADGGPR